MAPVLDLLPPAGVRVLDIGAGTGVLADWLCDRGCAVTAVDPVPNLRASDKPRWIDDSLPDLDRVEGAFDALLLSGLWHHLTPETREAAWLRLAELTEPGGAVLMSLRHGPGHPERPAFPISEEAEIEAAARAGLRLEHRRGAASIQAGNIAAGVTWTWLALRRD
ncbi:MAG: class I SAM-dependent methyltransferase [Pseudomonadota bacterium]